jgi:hypothetical protein
MKEKYRIYFRIPFTWFYVAKLKIERYEDGKKDKALFCLAIREYVEPQRMYKWNFLFKWLDDVG